MSDATKGAPFDAEFIYTEDVLADFEAMYLQKKETPLAMRIALGVLGAAGAIYFGYAIYREGLALTRVGYLVICSMMMLVALARGKSRPDDTLAKYRKHYLNRKATFHIDDEGLTMHLEGQKNFARSKFKEIYGLFDTDRCFYFVIKGRAYYILPRDSLPGGLDDALKAYMQKKCAKRFQHYDLARQ